MVLLEFLVAAVTFLAVTESERATRPSPKLTKVSMPKESRFTVDSKLRCEEYGSDVHVGTGGMSNLNAHRPYIPPPLEDFL